VRYLPDGKPDPGFGTGGIMTTDVLAGHGSQANAVAVQPDGKIVVAGLAAAPAAHRHRLRARTLQRRREPGHDVRRPRDHDHRLRHPRRRCPRTRPLARRPDRRGRHRGRRPGPGPLHHRRSPRRTFGQAGKTTTAFGTEALAGGVALTASGQILIAGTTLGPKPDRDFLLARYSADGAPDATFGDHGIVKTDLGSGDDFAENLAVDAQGRIVLVGRASSATILDMALVRYQPDGSLDTSFVGDGILTADFHGRGEFGQDVALDTQGRIVAGGHTANGGETEFALMRANP